MAAGATGAWAGQSNKIAAWQDGAWSFFAPATGWRAQVEDERLAIVWQDGAWRDRIVGTANRGAIRLVAS